MTFVIVAFSNGPWISSTLIADVRPMTTVYNKLQQNLTPPTSIGLHACTKKVQSTRIFVPKRDKNANK